MGAFLAFQNAWGRCVRSLTQRALVLLVFVVLVGGSTNSYASQVQINGSYVFAPDVQTRLAAFEAGTSTNLTTLGVSTNLFGATAIALQGKYAYVTSTNGVLSIFDVSIPNVMTHVRDVVTLGMPSDIEVAGVFAFVAEGPDGVQTFDLSDPENPVHLYVFGASGDGNGVEFTNNLLFIAAGTNGLRISDMSTASPQFVTNKVTATAARHLRIGGNYAFVTCDSGRLEIINIQNPSTPTLAGTFLAGGDFSDLDLTGNFVVLANTNGAVLTVNMSNPAAPILQSSNFVAGGASGLRVTGSRAYVRNGAGNLAVLQLAGPSSVGPSITQELSETTELVGDSTTLSAITVGSPNLQFQWRKNGVALVNGGRFQGVNTPYLNITNLALTDTGGYSLTVSNTFGTVTSSNQLFVVTAGTPILRSAADVGGEALGLDIVNDTAYVASGVNGVEIFDITYPRHLVRQGGTDAPPIAYVVHVIGSYAFVSVGAGGLKIFDVSNPGVSSLLGQTNTPGTAYNFDIVGGTVYLADGESGLQIINATVPASPIITGSFDTPGTAYAVKVSGGFAYVADGTGGLRILNVTNPAIITQVGNYSAATDARNVKIVGNIAYVASGTNGLLFLNITNPALPVLIGSYAVGQTVLDVEVVGNIAILAKGTNGLETINIANPSAITQMGVNLSLTNARALRVQGSTLGVADGLQGLKIFQIVGVPITVPALTTLPVDVVALPGDNVTFNAAATGVAPFNFQWFKDGTALFNTPNISGAASATLFLTNVQFTSTATYRITVRDAWNIPVSYEARLTVVPVGTPVQRFASGDDGDVLNTEVFGQIAYVANRTAGLQIMDCRNPLAPVKVSEIATASFAQEVCMRGHFAYVAVWDAGLEIFDVANPTNIVRVGGCDTPGLASGVHVVGQRAYISDSQGGLACVDVVDPANPRWISSTATTDIAQGVRVSTNYAYVAATGGGLEIYNVTNPLGMWRVSQLDTPGSAESVTLSGGRAYIADYDQGVRIVNVSNPAAPQLLGSFKTTNDTFQVQPVNSLTHLAEGFAHVESLNISNPAAPAVVLQSIGGSRVHGLQVIGKHAFIADRDLGFIVSELLGLPPLPPQIVESSASLTNIIGTRLVLSVASQGTPPLSFQWFKNGSPMIANTNILGVDQPHFQIPTTTTTNAGNYSVVVSSPYGSTTSAVTTVTMKTYGSPVARGSFNTPGSGLATVVQGSLAFIADGASGLRILDVNDPDAPVQVSSYAPTGIVYGVCIRSNLLYLALGTNGLEIVNVSNPTLPVRVGGCDTPGTAFNVEVQGGIAYVADGSAGLQIISVTNPASPTILASYNTDGIAYDVRVSYEHAFIADGLSGLHIANVSTPTNPSFVSLYETLGTAFAVRIVGSRAYVADGAQGLLVLDVEDPATPSLLGAFSNGGNVVGLDVSGTLVMLANNTGGYLVLDATTPASISLVGSNSTGGIALSAQIVGNMAFLSSGTNGLRLVELSGVALLPPNVAAPPASLSVEQNGTAHFYCAASGSVPLACRWFYNGQALFDGGQISGASTSHLIVSNITFANSGSYSLRLWNAAGVTNSLAAQLSFIGLLQVQINNAATGAVISVSSGVFPGILTLNKDVTIVGQWWDKPVLDAEQLGPVMRVLPGVTANLRGLSLRNGSSVNGGGIINEGTLTLDHCLIADNSATAGGGIVNFGTINLFQSVVSNNTASASGGGISTATNATTRMTNSVVTANISSEGAGMINFGNTVISRSLISSNNASGLLGNGGGICSYGGLLVINHSTVSGNRAAPNVVVPFTGLGAGVRVANGTVQINSSTIAFNNAVTHGGGLSIATVADVQSFNSIFANNQSPLAPDFGGVMNSLGWNLVQNTSGTDLSGTSAGNLFGMNPLLQPLSDNGGPTFTHKLAPNSPAIDAGTVATNTTDQRGIRRPFDIPWAGNSANAADIGAFEYVNIMPYLILSNRTAAGFTLAWASNTVLQKTSVPNAGWTDQTNLSPIQIFTLTNPANFFRLRGVLPLAVLTTNNQTTNGFDLSWPEFGILEHAPTTNGPWDALTGISPFHVTIVPAQNEFFRLRVLEN